MFSLGLRTSFAELWIIFTCKMSPRNTTDLSLDGCKTLLQYQSPYISTLHAMVCEMHASKVF